MKRSTFRKSSLISSVALLLVAIVALSGATFAWFSSSEKTTVSGLKLQATATNGLYIIESSNEKMPKDDAPGWDTSLNFGMTSYKNLVPTSTLLGTDEITNAGFVTTSSSRPDGAWETGTEINTASNGADYIMKQFWVKGSSETATDLNATITWNGNKKGYERIAIIDITDSENPVYVEDSILAAGAESWNPLTASGVSSATLTAIACPDSEVTVAENWKPTDGKHFVVYLWFEGQDSQCINTNSGGQIDFSMEFSLPVEATN